MITQAESEQQARAFTDWQHRQTHKPNEQRFNGAEKYKKRVKIDAKLQRMADAKQLNDDIGGQDDGNSMGW